MELEWQLASIAIRSPLLNLAIIILSGKALVHFQTRLSTPRLVTRCSGFLFDPELSQITQLDFLWVANEVKYWPLFYCRLVEMARCNFVEFNWK